MTNDNNLKLAQDKLAALEKAWILETKADIIFELKHQISELKQAYPELSLETNLSDKKEELKSIFYVPRVRNEYFTGREEILKELHEKLQQNKVVALNQKTSSIAVHGLGGMGKTQTLIEYAHRQREHYAAVLWVSAESKETFELGFQTLAFELKIPIEGKPFEEIKSSVENWLIANKNKWLLLIDNADELEIIKHFLAKVKGYGQILISTRAQSTRPFAEPLALEKMTKLEAFEFLEKRTGLFIDQYAKKIVEILDYLPLALDQAAAYISETQMSFKDYLDIYQSDSVSLLNERGEILDKQDHPDPIAKTWLISFEKVQQKSELAIAILYACAFLSPDGIIEEIFKDIPKKDFNDALKEILSYSLLKRDAQLKRLSMHRLVQVVVRHQLSKEQQTSLTTEVVKLVAYAYKKDETDFTAWLNRNNEWLLNARKAQRWINAFQLQFKEVGALFIQMGYYLDKIAQYEQAELLYVRSLEIDEQIYGKDHLEVAIDLNNLANLYLNQGKYKQALPLYVRSLGIREQVLGKNHPNVAQIFNNLANLYLNQEKYEQAELLFVRSLEIWEQELGKNHPLVATNLNNLAMLYLNQGKYEQAEPRFKRALKIREQVLEKEHPDIAQSLNNLANLYSNQGNYEKALPLFEESVRIFVKVLGEQHPSTKKVKENYELCLESAKNPVKFETKATKISRNDPCPCGSGKKYKYCHGKL